jgi:hypothetical protein
LSRRALYRGLAAIAIVHGLLMAGATAAAAAPPSVVSVAVAENSVTAGSATLEGSINPNGAVTAYGFEYITAAAYEANLAAVPPRDPFSGALSVGGSLGAGTTAQPVKKPISGLAAATPYRFRLRASHAGEEVVFSPVRPFATAAATNLFELLDHRGWEMVSPIEKAGGAIQPPGTIAGGGTFQAAAGGGSVSFSSADSFAAGAEGAPAGSQYVATRGGAGWSTQNISTPLLSGSYGNEPDGVPYQLFSSDLGSSLLSNGERCRGQAGGECAVANPSLPGSGAPAGYRNYYLRTAAGFQALLDANDVLQSPLGPEQLEVRLGAATPDLAHVVLSSCAALTANTTEVSAPGGCDPAAQNLYEWSAGTLSLLNLLPGQATGTPGAAIAAANGAISADGARAYFTEGGGVYLREGSSTKVVLEGGGLEEFGGASADGSIAYLVDAGNLARFSAASETLTPLTGSGTVEGILGVSADGSKVYYAEAGAVFLRGGATTTEVASSALDDNWPAATGTARVSADGSSLVFLSKAELTGYPNDGETEVFHYGPPPGGGGAVLSCVSCNPSGERPQGSAAIPGARRNGAGADAYKPRALSADGQRVFFETTDSLVARDTNDGVTDVYEWEAMGEGTCVRIGGCVQLISGGRDLQPSYFLDADADGSEAFFLTAASLYPLDPGSYDVYVAREGGGFPAPEEPVPCVADACQVLPEAPEDPTPGTLVPNGGNPPLKVAGESGKKKPKPKKKHKKHRTQAGKKKKGSKR